MKRVHYQQHWADSHTRAQSHPRTLCA